MARYAISLLRTASSHRILSGKRRDVDILPNLVAVPLAPHILLWLVLFVPPHLYKQKPQALQNQNESIDLQFAVTSYPEGHPKEGSGRHDVPGHWGYTFDDHEVNCYIQ